jgi:hypothetical protein
MGRQRRSYSIEEANALVPQVRAVLLQLAVEQQRLEQAHHEMHRRLDENGDANPDARAAEAATASEAKVAEISEGMRGLMGLLEEMGVQVRDVEMGLVDFPGERNGEPVWLCWRLADPHVAHWHGTNEGYATRRPW